MEKCKRCEISCKEKTRENSPPRTQRLLGIVRNVYHKIEYPATTHSPAYKAAETLKEYRIKAEQKKAEAEFLLRRRLTIY